MKTSQKIAAPLYNFDGSVIWMGLPTSNLLIPTECKHTHTHKKARFLRSA